MIWLNRKGFTLVEIMIVVAIIGLLAVIAIPNFVRARTRTQAVACVDQLKNIHGAKEEYAFQNNLSSGALGDAGTTFVTAYFGGTLPTCPAGGLSSGVYELNAIGATPTCPNDAVTGMEAHAYTP